MPSLTVPLMSVMYLLGKDDVIIIVVAPYGHLSTAAMMVAKSTSLTPERGNECFITCCFADNENTWLKPITCSISLLLECLNTDQVWYYKYNLYTENKGFTCIPEKAAFYKHRKMWELWKFSAPVKVGGSDMYSDSLRLHNLCECACMYMYTV